MGKQPDHMKGVDAIGRPVVLLPRFQAPKYEGDEPKPAKVTKSALSVRAAVAAAAVAEAKRLAKRARHKGRILQADCSDSECFSELIFQDGAVYATFAKDGSQYVYPMSRSEAREWFGEAGGDGLGEYFNEEIK